MPKKSTNTHDYSNQNIHTDDEQYPPYCLDDKCYDDRCDNEIPRRNIKKIDPKLTKSNVESKYFNGDISGWNDDDDIDNWEYISDGKRICFININTGLRVYHGDSLFHKLKNKMLEN